MKIKTSILLIFIFLIITIPTISATPLFMLKIDQINLSFEIPKENLDMLIFLSPQYSNEIEIKQAINNYIKTVSDDIGWNTKVVKITKENNNYKIIDQIIEQNYYQERIKACIMVGEDLDTPLAGDTDFLEKPTTIPWATVGLENAYQKTSKGIISKPCKIDICISLLYPPSTTSFRIKKAQIIAAFDKFSKNRNEICFEQITVFESSDINFYSKHKYQNLKEKSFLNYFENPKEDDLELTLNKQQSMFFIHGHSSPSKTQINFEQEIYFTAEMVDNLKTPFFGADGCYVGGWFSKEKDNDKLDSSIDDCFYSSKIFTGKHVKTMVLGHLTQDGYENKVSFIENGLEELINGKTVAESMIGKTIMNCIVVGDPTFHYLV